MEPWNLRGTLPQGRPGPPRSLSGLRPQSFQLLGGKKHGLAILVTETLLSTNMEPHKNDPGFGKLFREALGVSFLDT